MDTNDLHSSHSNVNTENHSNKDNKMFLIQQENQNLLYLHRYNKQHGLIMVQQQPMSSTQQSNSTNSMIQVNCKIHLMTDKFIILMLLIA